MHHYLYLAIKPSILDRHSCQFEFHIGACQGSGEQSEVADDEKMKARGPVPITDYQLS